MAKYKIVEPCAFLQDGKAVHHTEAGAVVELDDAEAKRLGAAVESAAWADRLDAGLVKPPQKHPKLPNRRKSEPEGNDD